MTGEDVERAWKELKGGIVEAACVGLLNGQRVYGKKRLRWWNEEVKEAVKKKNR